MYSTLTQEEIDRIQLTMCNHGDAYRILNFPETTPASIDSVCEALTSNEGAILLLIGEAVKYHEDVPYSALRKQAMICVYTWICESFE
jgi:hypothetical protein